ncbi:MAG: Bro-N domain-containing protein [Acidaminococcaceae bacterium]
MELQVFSNTIFGDIRIIEKNGEPWFVAKDVCDVFGETNRNRAMQCLDDDEKGYTQIVTTGGKQQTAIVSESGLYSMLFAMQPSKARGVDNEYVSERQQKLKVFKRWVFDEVLPSIRKHGAYMTPQTIDELIEDPDTLIRLATNLKSRTRA